MKVLIADDHDLVAHALAALLVAHDPDITTDHVTNLPDTLGRLRSNEDYAAVLLDFRMPGMNGIDSVRQAVQVDSDTPIILMSGSINTSQIRRAIEAGARGFVPKTLSGPALINAIRIVASGESYVPTSVFENSEHSRDSAVTNAFTPRELDVLSQLKLGSGNKEIARGLGIAETTVKLHLRTMSEKLRARNRTEIVVRAFELGLIE